MKVIARFDAPEHAYLFRSFLASRGISVAVLDENMAQWFWICRSATGGVRVVLDDPADFHTAEAAKEEYFASISTEPEEEVVAWPVAAAVSLFMGVPMPIFGKRPNARKQKTT